MNYTELKKQALESYFSNMNDRQREAVFSVKGPVQIIAGAGTGKTTVLVNRIVNMVLFGNAYYDQKVRELSPEEERFLIDFPNMEKTPDAVRRLACIIAAEPVEPWNILAVTFTNKAAAELRQRLAAVLDEDAQSVNAATFHSSCMKILRREIEKLGYKCNFGVCSESDSKSYIKEIIKDLGLEDEIASEKDVQDRIRHLKEHLIRAEEYAAGAADPNDPDKKNISLIYTEYQRRLKENNALDFGDMICLTSELFKRFPEVLRHYGNKYKYIMVDEYQDTDMAQDRLLAMLSENNGNLCVVGDDDQSIYSFRGAEVENILNFERTHPGCKVVRLEQNYRSTSTILNAANAIIAKNPEHLDKKLWSDLGEGCKIEINRYETPQEEAQAIVDAIALSVENGAKYSDHAVLYRTAYSAKIIKNAFNKAKIGYTSKEQLPPEIEGGERPEFDDTANHDAVRMMTIHGAKGLEFPIVFIVGANDNNLPHYKSQSSSEIAEERRMAYVAVTRAKQRLVITYPYMENSHKHPLSPFFYEIPDELCLKNETLKYEQRSREQRLNWLKIVAENQAATAADQKKDQSAP